MTLLIHVAAGGLGLVAGFLALFVAKGGRLHRRSGMVFVYALTTMALTGAGIAALHGKSGSVIAGLLTAYLVITALTAVRPFEGSRWVDRGALLVALAVGVVAVGTGGDALARGVGVVQGVPAPMYLLFGTVALLGAGSDVRAMRAGGLRGAARLARHLWRMCFALWMAAASFFLGQPDVFPEVLRGSVLLVVPVLVPLVAMVWWLGRVRLRKSLPGIVVAGSSVPPRGRPRRTAA